VVRVGKEARGDGTEGLVFTTKGDANNAEDPPVQAEQLVGRKVLVIPKAGAILRTVKANVVPFAVLAASVIGFVSALSYFFAGSKKIKRRET